MRILAVILGTAAAIGFVAAASADPRTDRIQLAQAQQSGGEAGAGMRGGDREGAAAPRSSESKGRDSGGAQAKVKTEGTSRTTIRKRSESARISVRGGSRTTVGVRAESDDPIVIKRKKAKKPKVLLVKKKKKKIYTAYDEPSSIVVKKRRPGVAVGGSVSTRTTVRSRTSTTVRGSRDTVGAGGKGSAGESDRGGGGRSGGESTGRSAPSGGGAQSAPARQ